GSETGEREAVAPLDEQLDDVAGEDEDEGDENREIRRRQGVEDELGEEVGRQPCRARGEREQPREGREQHHDARQNQAGVVAKWLTPAAGRTWRWWRRRRPRGCRNGTSAGGHYSFAFRRSFNSVMNSPMSRKWRYTEANRTYATLSSRLS